MAVEGRLQELVAGHGGPLGEVPASMPGIGGGLPLVLSAGADGSERTTLGPALRRTS